MAEPKLELVKIEAATEQVSGASRRYVHDAYAAKHFRDAARKVALRLRKMVESDAQWDALRPREQVAVAGMILDRAYGRVETISQEDKSAPQESVGALPEHLRSLAGLLVLPELKNSAKAEK